jgi:hypothetical protein
MGSEQLGLLGTVRIILSLATHFGWELYQLDVKTEFLLWDLEYKENMDISSGYNSTDERNKVCRLTKSLYGLKQFPCAWFGWLTRAIVS